MVVSVLDLTSTAQCHVQILKSNAHVRPNTYTVSFAKQTTSSRLSFVCCSSRSSTDFQTENPASSDRVARFGKHAVIPEKLLSRESEGIDKNVTVYTLRFTTANKRGSSLDEPNAAVQVCLVNAEGAALLQRIPPVIDAKAMQGELDRIEKVFYADTQGRRKFARKSPTAIAETADGKIRFQSGSVDELCFLGPDLGPIKSVLVAPESGSWRLDELTVASSATQHTDRFLCGRLLGAKEGAGYLTPVPPNAVVYGSGEAASIISRAEARALHEAGMGRYKLFKERLLQANATLVGLGTGLGWTFCGDEVALEFGTGGLAGLAYMWLLQNGVDRIGLSTSSSKVQGAGFKQRLFRLLGSGGFRLTALAGLGVACAIYGTHARLTSESHGASLTQAQQILIGAAGFMMYKVATIGVLTVPPLFKMEDQR